MHKLLYDNKLIATCEDVGDAYIIIKPTVHIVNYTSLLLHFFATFRDCAAFAADIDTINNLWDIWRSREDVTTADDFICKYFTPIAKRWNLLYTIDNEIQQ